MLKGLGIVSAFGPAVQQVAPGAGPVVQTIVGDISKLLNIITTTEAVGQALSLPGADKAKAAGPLIMQEFLQVMAATGHTIANGAAAQAASVTIAGGIADFLNAVHPQVATTPMMTTPPATT